MEDFLLNDTWDKTTVPKVDFRIHSRYDGISGRLSGTGTYESEPWVQKPMVVATRIGRC